VSVVLHLRGDDARNNWLCPVVPDVLHHAQVQTDLRRFFDSAGRLDPGPHRDFQLGGEIGLRGPAADFGPVAGCAYCRNWLLPRLGKSACSAALSNVSSFGFAVDTSIAGSECFTKPSARPGAGINRTT